MLDYLKRHFMREIYRILKPGSRCFVTTPNNLSLASKVSLLFRGHFRDFSDNCYPAHITAMVKKDLERIVTEAGFELREITYSGEGRVPFSSMTWQKVAPWFKDGCFLSDNIGVDLLKPVSTV